MSLFDLFYTVQVFYLFIYLQVSLFQLYSTDSTTAQQIRGVLWQQFYDSQYMAYFYDTPYIQIGTLKTLPLVWR